MQQLPKNEGQPAAGEAIRQQEHAMRLSLVVGFLMLAGKTYAYFITGSAAILSDAAESVIHVFAVGFAYFSLHLSLRPADASHPYGHDRISYFSAGVEGMLIVIAAAYIIYEAVLKWLGGLPLQRLDTGVMYVAAASLINGALGSYLIWQGKRHRSLILTANGKHVLTDFWTSLGVIVGLLLVLLTGWKAFDPLLAILVAVNILWSGGKLMRQSVGGLMDEGDPNYRRQIQEILEQETSTRHLHFHQLRYRNSGRQLWVDVHLLFPNETSIERAHWQATEIEAIIEARLPLPTTITTHLEPVKLHDHVHLTLKEDRH